MKLKIKKPEKKETTGVWRSEFQYLLNRKILSRDELAYLFGQIKSIIEQEKNQALDSTPDTIEIKIDVGKVIKLMEDKHLGCGICLGSREDAAQHLANNMEEFVKQKE